MKLLLDENLPHQMRHEIPGHEVFTTAYMGWAGIENGALLARAAAEGFDALLTTDRGLEYEQNTAALPIAVVVLIAKTNTIDSFRLLYPRLQASLNTLRPHQVIKVG